MEDRFEIVEEPTQQEESIPQTLARGVARGASRVFETAAGLPGDILSTVSGAANYLTGGATPTYEEFTKDKPFAPRTSAQIRQATEGLSEGYLAPQSTGEQFVDDIISDVTSLAIPIGGKIPLKSAFVRSLGGNIASAAAKEAGFGQAGQAIAKFTGMSLAGGIGTRKALQSQAKENAQKADEIRNAIPKVDKYVDASNLYSEALKLTRKAYTDIKTPKNKAIDKAISPIFDAFVGKKISVDDALDFKQSINELLDATKDKNARSALQEISSLLNEPIKKFGKQHPEWYKSWSVAKDISEGIEASNNILSYLKDTIPSGFIKNNVLDKWFGKGAAAAGLAGAAFKYGLGSTLKGGAAAAASAASGKAIAKPIILALKSEAGRKAYFDVIKDAIQQNPKSLLRNISKLDKIVQKYEDEEPRFEIIEHQESQ